MTIPAQPPDPHRPYLPENQDPNAGHRADDLSGHGTYGPPPAPYQPDRPYTLDNLMPGPTPAPTLPGPDRSRIRAWVAIVAGAAIIIASFLPWASVTAPLIGTMSVSGTDGGDGWITAAIGAALEVYGAMTVRRRPHPAITALAALASLGAAVMAAWKIVELRQKVTELRAEMAADAADDQLGIGRAMADAVHVRIGAGLWLLTAAGLVAAVYLTYAMIRRA